MTNEDFIDYMKNLSIDADEKNRICALFNKKKYIDMLNQKVIDMYPDMILHSSMGNFNSRIAMIVPNNKSLSFIKKFLTPVFEYVNISLWNIYITCLEKHDAVSAETCKLFNDMLSYEIEAVSPEFIIRFSKKQSFTKSNFTANKKQIPVIDINIDDVLYVLDKDNFKTEQYTIFMDNMYKFLVTLIPFKEIELSE